MPTFNDSQFMSAAEKAQVLKAWERFLKSGLQEKQFTKALYHHLTQHCSFIAHYDRAGFYGTYFGHDKQATRDFLRQFQTGNSVEYGGRWWLDGDYADINRAMMLTAQKHIPTLIRASRNDSFEEVAAR